jgi:hypothetical protein
MLFSRHQVSRAWRSYFIYMLAKLFQRNLFLGIDSTKAEEHKE